MYFCTSCVFEFSTLKVWRVIKRQHLDSGHQLIFVQNWEIKHIGPHLKYWSVPLQNTQILPKEKYQYKPWRLEQWSIFVASEWWWSIFSNDGMAMKFLTLTIDGFWWDQQTMGFSTCLAGDTGDTGDKYQVWSNIFKMSIFSLRILLLFF